MPSSFPSFHLYAAVAGSPPFTGTPIIATYLLRPLHVGMVLALIYMLFPMAPGLRNRITPARLDLCRR